MFLFSHKKSYAIFIASQVPTGGLTADGRCLILSRWPSMEVKKGIGATLVFIEFFLPLAVITFCYMRMFKLMRNRVAPLHVAALPSASNDPSGSSSGHAHTLTNDSNADRNARARRNILKTLVIVSACFTLCWIWNEMYYFLTNLGLVTLDYSHPFNTFSVVCIYFNCCINPIIYVLHYKQFKKGLRMLGNRIRGIEPSSKVVHLDLPGRNTCPPTGNIQLEQISN